eukprot:g38943.t1
MDFKTIDYKDNEDLINKIKAITKNRSESLIILLIDLIKQKGGNQTYLKKKLKWVLSTIQHIDKVNTKDAYLTRLRKAFKEQHPTKEAEILKELKLTDEERTKKATTQIKQRNKNLKEIKNYEPATVFKIMDNLNKSKKMTDLIILLQLATGRRLIEVLRITSTPPESKEQKNYIIIDKVAKDKKGAINNIEVPLIHISYNDMRTAWEAVRETLTDEDKTKTNQELTNKYDGRISRRMKELFNDKKATSHLARKIYGAMAYREYAPANMDRSIFLSKVLGHVEESEASRNYANIKARTPAIATEPQARQALDKLENKINTLEDKVAGLNANLPKNVIDALAIIKAMKDQKINISNRKIREYARVGSIKAKFISDIAKGKQPHEAGKTEPRKKNNEEPILRRSERLKNKKQ